MSILAGERKHTGMKAQRVRDVEVDCQIGERLINDGAQCEENRRDGHKAPYGGHTNTIRMAAPFGVSLHARPARDSRTSICRWRQCTNAITSNNNMHAPVAMSFNAAWEYRSHPSSARCRGNRDEHSGRVVQQRDKSKYSTSPRIPIRLKHLYAIAVAQNLEERTVSHENLRNPVGLHVAQITYNFVTPRVISELLHR